MIRLWKRLLDPSFRTVRNADAGPRASRKHAAIAAIQAGTKGKRQLSVHTWLRAVACGTRMTSGSRQTKSREPVGLIAAVC
jgi:hypothetical protein